MQYKLESPADRAVSPIISRPGEGRMDVEDLRTHLHGVLTDCITYVDNELSPARANATDYYFGRPFGNEEEGRSQVVLTEVRDAVSATIPSLCRVFFGGERVVEFAPDTPDRAAAAEQATDYVQRIFEVDNNGFLQSIAVWKDALVRRIGGFKYWWEKDAKKVSKLYNVPESQLEVLAADDENELTEVTDTGETTKPTPEEQQQGAKPEKLYDVELTRTDKEGHPCIIAMPPEEILFARQARDRDHALLVGHRTEKTRGELEAMGIDKKLLKEWGHRDVGLENNPEELERRAATDTTGQLIDPPAGEANDKILYIEAYTTVDMDGDGFAELRLVKTIGPAFYPVEWDPADEIQMAFFTPDPEPHVLIGGSLADRTMDIQKTKSSVLRATLDSLALHIYPRMGYVEGQVSVEDILNTAIGAPMRMKAPGMVQPVIIPFVGEDALPVLSLLDDITERRTGKNKGVIGLDADALQSTGKEAAEAAISASQAQDDYLCRVFAEMCLKPMFRGLLRMLVQYQPRSKMVKLRGSWVTVDPSAWDADWGITVNVALGSQFTAKKLAVLDAWASKAENILAQMGPANPIVSVAQYGNTLKKAFQLSGFMDSSPYMNDVPPNWQPPPQQPQETPEQTIAKAQLQIEQMKTQRELAIKQAELELKQQDQQMRHQLEIKKAADDFILRRYQIDAQFHATFSEQQLESDASAQELWLKGQDQAHSQMMDQRSQAHNEAVATHQQMLAAQDQDHSQGLAEDQQAHDQSMAEQSAAADAQAGSDS